MAYLSTIKDGSSNDILAYHVSDRITLDIATTTIHKLINEQKNSYTRMFLYILTKEFIILALNFKNY